MPIRSRGIVNEGAAALKHREGMMRVRVEEARMMMCLSGKKERERERMRKTLKMSMTTIIDTNPDSGYYKELTSDWEKDVCSQIPLSVDIRSYSIDWSAIEDCAGVITKPND
jgi:hypothetical protein